MRSYTQNKNVQYDRLLEFANMFSPLGKIILGVLAIGAVLLVVLWSIIICIIICN